MNTKYTKELLERVVKDSYSIRQVLIKLNLKEAGGNYKNISERLKKFEISTLHFHGKIWNKGKTFKIKRDISKILCKDSCFSSGLPYSSSKIKQILFKHGLKEEVCEKCGLEEWLNKKIPLELHHRNGISNDNRIRNLEILCPNCHAFTDNYRGKNIKNMEDKRLEQKKESWIKNVMNVQDFTREEALELYEKIQPFRIEILKDMNDKVVITEGGIPVGYKD